MREVMGGGVGTRYAVNRHHDGGSSTLGSEDWGERLYLEGKHLMQRRLELWRPRPKDAEAEEAPQDWVCPKCFHTNAPAADACQRVVGRDKSLLDAAPQAWVHLPADATTLHGRRIAESIARCSQPRPQLFQPTVVALREYEATYGKPLPVAVRLRPENVFEELYARRFLAEQKRKALKLER